MSFEAALARIMGPLVRAAIARGVTFPDMSEMLKRLYVRHADEYFGIEGKRTTDSRISLLTGLQRREVKAFREDDNASPAESIGTLPRVVAKWLTRKHKTLKRDQFEGLVTSVNRDKHPRTILDELVRQGTVRVDGDMITLLTDGYIPTDDDDKLEYFGANLGDHAKAAVENITSETAPYFERAVHYNRLSRSSANELDLLARRLQQDALASLNKAALLRQKRDSGKPAATGRFRCGAFVYTEDPEEEL